MDKTATQALKLLREVKSVAFATVNDGEPAVRTADVMLVDEDGLYFIAARGKPYCRQLKADLKVAICGMDKDYVSVRVVGDFKLHEDREILNRMFERNPVMNDLYPGDKRDVLEVFHLYRGRGEIFDLSSVPPTRKRFAFGGKSVSPSGYTITDRCTACALCLDACPVGAISEGEIYSIDGERCLECGHCYETCPEDAIEPSLGL